jgi:predicted porin
VKHSKPTLGFARLRDIQHAAGSLTLTKVFSMQSLFSKSLISIAALAATGASFAQSAPEFTWYGRVDLALESNSNGSTNRTAIQNFSSRLGIRGEKKFDTELSGIFQVETGVAPDDTTQSKTLASRNSFVGIKSVSLGQLIIGTHDMPLKSMDGTAYGLWGEGDLHELIIHGKASKSASNTGAASAFDNVHTRKTNVLLYTSPKFSDVVVKFAYSPDEASTVTTATAPAYSKPMVGASIEYNNGMFNVGYAYQSQENAIAPTITLGGSSLQASKATVGMKLGMWSVGAAFSTIDNTAPGASNRKTNNWLLSTAYTMGKTTLKASYGASGESFGNAADDLTASAIEVDYALDKAFTLYSYYAQINNKKNAKGSFAAADNFPAVVKAGDSPTALGFGIRYNF